jgi:hypothetical protein
VRLLRALLGKRGKGEHDLGGLFQSSCAMHHILSLRLCMQCRTCPCPSSHQHPGSLRQQPQAWPRTAACKCRASRCPGRRAEQVGVGCCNKRGVDGCGHRIVRRHPADVCAAFPGGGGDLLNRQRERCESQGGNDEQHGRTHGEHPAAEPCRPHPPGLRYPFFLPEAPLRHTGQEETVETAGAAQRACASGGFRR